MDTPSRPYRLGFWRGLFYVLMAGGLILTYVRFTRGLGSVTNLNDTYPWGLWVGFDLLCGVGLAAGGFVLTAVVYIFHVERFRPIVRATILTAFLGYLLVVLALMYDLGRPWNIWHPLIMWNPKSVMFEVSWCVTLYTTVLSLEFSGMVFEKLKWKRAVKIQKTATVPLVVLGVLLSTLHQSSLGSMYLIVPGKLHTLWYTGLLPVLFFVSSVAAGLAMVIVESHLSARAFGRQFELPLLQRVARVLVAVLFVYGVIRFYDAVSRGVVATAFDFSYESWMFQLETFLGILLPMGLLAFPGVRSNRRGLYACGLLVVLGFVVNRLNVSITGLESAQGGHYIPAWSEVFLTLAIVAAGFAAFGLAARHLNVYPEEPGAVRASRSVSDTKPRVVLRRHL